MARLKNPYQLEYLVRDEWMPEGSLFDWGFVTSVRKIQVFTKVRFIKWAKKMNLKLAHSPRSYTDR